MCSVKPKIDPSLYKLDTEQIKGKGSVKAPCPLPREQLSSEFNGFEPISKKDPKHYWALLELFPKYLIESCDDGDWQLFEAMSRFDRRNGTFVVGCFDNQPLEFRLVSFKWRHKDNVKWKTRAGTSPNGTPFVRIYTDSETIYVIEGHRDSLSAVLLGLDFIMIPYAGFRLKEPAVLQNEVRNRKLVFLVEDETAYKCMTKVAEHLKETANGIRFIELSDTEKKMDLSDYVQQCNSIREVMNGLRNRR